MTDIYKTKNDLYQTKVEIYKSKKCTCGKGRTGNPHCRYTCL